MKRSNHHLGKVVTFGEVLMRLSPPENKKLQQSSSLDFFFGGTELNVAESLSYFGLDVMHVSNVSNDLVGEAALASIRQFGIDVSAINKVDYPLGLYFLEVGAAMRSSQVSYNRLNAAFANITPEEVDWKRIFTGASYFHWTGITPGISKSAYETLKAGLKEAKKQGVKVSADPAYRTNLWNYGMEGREILAELTGLSNIFIGGVNEINEILKTNFEFTKEGFIAASKRLMDTYPSIEKVFDKVRTSLSASWQKIHAQAWTGTQYLTTNELEIPDVVDRIGAGDAYAAGLLYGMQHFDEKKTLEFANAACALKHTILGDANLVSVMEVLEVARGDSGGRIKR